MSQRFIPYLAHQVPMSQFYGGQSADESVGTPSSFSYSRALEHRRNPSQLTVLPGPRKISAGVVQDLILNMVQVNSGTRYAMGDQGNIYKIDTSNVVTNLNKLPTGSDGMLYRSDSDAIYIATQTDLRRYYPISGTPTFDQIYGPSKSIDSAAYRTGGTVNYTVGTAVDEAQECYFQPDIEPFYSIKVNVIVKGTGDLTLTLHDGLNNVLATVTILNAVLTTGLVEFVFPSQIRALVKPNARTYHFHVTSTVRDTILRVGTPEVMNTVDFELWAYRLVQTVNGFHPIAQFQQFTLIGNGNYLAVWEPLTDANPPNNEFERHRLTFPSGFEVCGITVTNEFAVIACGKYATNGTKDFQEGKIFLWDGFGTTYNQVIDVRGGSPEAIQSHENYPYCMVNGTLHAWAGGDSLTKIRTFANTDTTYKDTVDNTHVYPNMMCIRDNLLHCGYPSTTTNTSIEHGIYAWGSLDKNYPASFNYAYVASAHQNTVTNTSGNLKLGCVRSFGDEMYMSWKDATGNYGLDIIDSFCDPAPIYKFRQRRFDAGVGYQDKQLTKISLVTATLPAGVSIALTHNVNAGGDFTHETIATGSTVSTAVVQAIQGSFKRVVTGFDGTCTGTVSPTIYTHTFQYQPNMDRRAL